MYRGQIEKGKKNIKGAARIRINESKGSSWGNKGRIKGSS